MTEKSNRPDKGTLRNIIEGAVKRDMPETALSAMQAFWQLTKTTGGIRRLVDEYLASQGISRGKFTVLSLLHDKFDTGLLPHELAEKAGVTRATITGLLDGLERQGFVFRVEHASDRRMRIIRLTEEGRNFLEEIFPSHLRRVIDIMSCLDEKELNELSRLLRKLQQGISSQHSE